MKCGRTMGAGLLTGVIAVSLAMTAPVYGASKKAISSVNLTINADIRPETDFGSETIEIETSSDRYAVDGYEILNTGFEWEKDTVPELRITLNASDDYYFKVLNKDQLKLKGDGAEFVKGTRQNSSQTLLLEIRLTSLANTVGSIASVQLSQEGIASWPAVSNAGSYEVKVYRGSKAIGAPQQTQSTSINCRERMTKGDESYTVRVRAVNQNDTSVTSDWTESNSVYVSSEQAEQFRSNPMDAVGAWKQETDGRWRYKGADGAYAANTWLQIAGKWYFFGEDGYMRTGWIPWNGKYYYCAEDGSMLTDCMTPDSYLVGSDGAWIAQKQEQTDEEMQREWEALKGTEESEE